MKMSESIKSLAAALAAAQSEMPAAGFNATNPFLKNRFADLGSIISTAKPVLAKHGLSVSQLPVTIDECIGVTTILMHSSGEWIESTITLPLASEKGKSLAQTAGSIITYLRRYSLSAVLSMYAEEDSDGSDANAAPKKASPTMKKAKMPQPIGPPQNMTDLYIMAQNDLGLGSQDAAAILSKWLEKNHATKDLGAYVKNGNAGAVATLWQVLQQPI